MESRHDGDGVLRVRARGYSLQLDPRGPWLDLEWPGGRVRLGAGAGDGAGRWSLHELPDETGRVTLSADDGRRLELQLHEEWIYAWAELPQPGEAPALLVGPDLPRFDRLFSPEPTALRRHHFAPHERAIAAVGSDPAFHEGHWFFSPPPFCFALESEAGSLAVGVACPPEELDFSALEYDGAFRLRYDRAPAGPYRSPRLLLLPVSGDGYRGVEAYCDHLRDQGLAPRGTGRERAAWWSEPNFCGWGEQSYRGCALPGFTPGRLPDGAPERATRRLYEELLELLEVEGIDPGVVTVDDKWQRAYGLARPDETRWPDMAGFIARQHARGRKVLLWWKLWDGEGLPQEELLPGGSRPVVDPTSPAYRARLAGEVRHALRELDADGFKIDFLHRGPTPEHGAARGGISGVRLLRVMLEAMRDPALEAKADCLLVAHAANPYLADLADVVRLNDISCPPGVESLASEMRHRARLARAACPEALIDADNWPCPDRKLWREYVAAQPEIGVPGLYYATGVDMSGEPFRPEDYALVRESWARWRNR
ncbi:MAG: alpha-amylase family protein [Chloroflexota bacterium]